MIRGFILSWMATSSSSAFSFSACTEAIALSHPLPESNTLMQSVLVVNVWSHTFLLTTINLDEELIAVLYLLPEGWRSLLCTEFLLLIDDADDDL